MGPAFTLHDGTGPVVATAIHAGHELRPEVAAAIAVDDATRRREEDPHTDRLTTVAPVRLVVHRSRFEVDPNRPRHRAVYRQRGDAWGLEVWARPPSDELVARSLEVYDELYGALAARLDVLAADGPFVVLDIHSYNHRRDGADHPPAPDEGNPEVNVGTGSLDRHRWAALVDRFVADLRNQAVRGNRVDVRENVRFTGGHLAAWAHDRYPARACVLALELKKTFMDEWSGEVDDDHLGELRVALEATVPGLLEELGRSS